jgi:hypothetical protein
MNGDIEGSLLENFSIIRINGVRQLDENTLRNQIKKTTREYACGLNPAVARINN